MGCNCGDNEYNISIDSSTTSETTTPIYNIALGNVGVDGFSPSINIINQTSSSFQLEITDINGRTVTDSIPLSGYVDTTFAKLASANTFTANNTFNGLTYFNGTMYTDKVYSKTPATPLIIGGNSSTITLGANDTTANYHGYEIVNTNDLTTTLASYSTSAEIANTYLEKDGSNASSDITINNMPIKTYSGSGSRLGNGGSLPALCIQSRDIRLQNYDSNNSLLSSIQLTNGNVYIGANNKALYKGNEIATVNNIPTKTSDLSNDSGFITSSDLPTVGDGTITITQGGVTKGIFTTNQSGNATIELDAGSAITNPLVIEDEDSTYSLSMGIGVINGTRQGFISVNTAPNNGIPVQLINSVSSPLKLNDLYAGTKSISLGYDNDTIKVNQDGQLYADVQSGTTYTAGTGIDITSNTISIDTSVVAQLSDIPDVSNFVTSSDLATTLTNYVQTTTLATVATSGSYNDLTNKPTIPTVPTNISAFVNDSGYITNSALSGYALSSSLATVATTGSYNDLINKPTIPTVNDPTITFTQGGISKGTITLNQSSNQTIALDASGGVTNPITLAETVGTDVNTLELGIETDNGNPVLNFNRVVNSGGSSYTLNWNLLRYATAKSNGGLKDNWATDFIGCSGNQLEVKVDNDTIKINGSGELYVDTSSSGIIDADTLNDAMDNKEDVFDQIVSPLAVTYTNGLVNFNGSNCYVTSDGILTGDTAWCTVDVSANNTNIINDYWEWHGSFKYSSISTDTPLIGLWTATGGFALDINSSGEVYNEDDSSNILATVAADTWISFKFVHQANSNTVEVTLLNSQGVLETHSSPIDQSTTGVITDFNWRVDTTAGVEFDLSSPESYYILIPNGSHNTFLYRNLEVDKYAFDGQWVSELQTLISSATSLSGSTNLTYRVQVPNDGHIYEVYIRGKLTTGSATGNYVECAIAGNQDNYNSFLCSCRTRTNSNVMAMGSCIIHCSYVASGSTNMTVTRSSTYTGALEGLYVIGYRRIGTNS